MTEHIKIIADYQLMSDSAGLPWMTETLAEARDKGLIEDFEVLGSFSGVWGLQYIVFTVTAAREVVRGETWEEAKFAATSLLNGPIVPDSDVIVRWISPVQEEFALSDCVNWGTNERGDCGGRVERVDGAVLCENCRNRKRWISPVQDDLTPEQRRLLEQETLDSEATYEHERLVEAIENEGEVK